MKGRKLTIEPGIDEPGIRADVYVEDDANTVYDVEMQTTDKPLLRKTIVMFVCTFDPFHRDLPVYHFQHRSSEDCSLILDDAAEIVFVNASYVGELAEGELRALLRYIMDGSSSSEFTSKIAVAIRRLNHSEEGRRLMTLEMVMREEKQIAREEGREEGRVEGREEGRRMLVFELLEVGDLSLELAAKCLNLSVEEVEKEFESYKAQKK